MADAGRPRRRADRRGSRRGPLHEAGEARGRAAEQAPEQAEQDQAEHRSRRAGYADRADAPRRSTTERRHQQHDRPVEEARRQIPDRDSGSMFGRPIIVVAIGAGMGELRRGGADRVEVAAPRGGVERRAPRPAAPPRRGGSRHGRSRFRAAPGCARRPPARCRAGTSAAPAARSRRWCGCPRGSRRCEGADAAQLLVDPLHRRADLLVIGLALADRVGGRREAAAVATIAATAAAVRTSCFTQGSC